MTHEFEFIEQLKTHRHTHSEVICGIGDDCAIWQVGNQQVLLATDLLIEGIHFDLNQITCAQAGRKALAVNLSDIAAMAGIPRTALVSLGIPKSMKATDAESLMGGIEDLATEYEVAIVGGDTTSHNGPLFINVAITGVMDGRALLRSEAKSGDILFVTGPLGGSLTGHHWSFTPRVKESRLLRSMCDVSSMIDLSDGLASDIRHIANASRVGCVLTEDAIPISHSVENSLSHQQRLLHAISDGEDFELLLTVSADEAETLRRQTEIEMYEIGIMQGDADEILMRRRDGTLVEVSDSGWKHEFQ